MIAALLDDATTILFAVTIALTLALFVVFTLDFEYMPRTDSPKGDQPHDDFSHPHA